MRDSEHWHCDAEGHRQQQMTAGLAATPVQRLGWLEEAIEIAFRAGALPRR